MNVLLQFLLILVAVPTLLGQDTYVPAHWKLFESRSQRFSVRYPPSWNRLQGVGVAADSDRLEIINFPNAERVEGVIIKKWGALIQAGAPPDGVRSIDDWLRRYYVDDATLDDRDIPVGSPPTGGCVKLRRVVTRSEVGPGTYFISTDYFCSAASGFYSVSLTNWQGDPHQSELQDKALRIALSLRTR